MRSSVLLLVLSGLTVTLVGPAGAQARRAGGDAPEISRSPGTVGGVVVLWPRIIPGTERERSRVLAADVQIGLEILVKRTLPGRMVDRRPRPERVCRRAGCIAMSVGALLVRKGGGCAVVALISRPGISAARLVPWAGDVRLKRDTVPFREHPEAHISITDFARCSEVLSQMRKNERKVAQALRFAARPVKQPAR